MVAMAIRRIARPLLMRAAITLSRFGDVVSFDGTGTDTDGSIVKYEWDFDGDGVYDWSSGTSGSTTHAYGTAGTYTAILRVTDNKGATDTDTREITVSQKTTTLDISGTWSGVLEGGWTETYQYPEDMIGGGVNTLVFSYKISLIFDVKDDGSFVGEASIELGQPEWNVQYTTHHYDGHYTELIDYSAEISPTEFNVPIHGFMSVQGEIELNLSDVPERHQVYSYVTEDDYGNRDSWETGFDFPAITDYYNLVYVLVDSNVISILYWAAEENPGATIPSSYREEATGTLCREE